MFQRIRSRYAEADSETQIKAIVFFVTVVVTLILFSITAVHDYATGHFFSRIGNKIAIPVLIVCMILIYTGHLLAAMYMTFSGISIAAIVGVIFGPVAVNHILGMPFLVVFSLYFSNIRFTVIGVSTATIVIVIYNIRLHLAGMLTTRFVLDSVSLLLPFIVMSVLLVRYLLRNLSEKEALLREVHHRVKNNLQLIRSLLRLEAEKRGEDPRYLDRINSIAGIHELLYQSGGNGRVRLHEMITRIVAYQNRRVQYQESTVDIRPLGRKDPLLPLETAVPVGLIINELVSNALVHGSPPGSESSVRVMYDCLDGGLLVRVLDRGRGFPASYLNDPPGTLGLLVVDLLLKQLGGSIRTETDDGTLVEFYLADRKKNERAGC